MQKKVVYIAHPIGGDVEGNLKSLRKIIHHINTCPQYQHIIPFVSYYADVVSLNDDDPVQRQRGISNGLHFLSLPGVINELWVTGHSLTSGMKGEVLAAINNGIPVCAFNTLYAPLQQYLATLKNPR